MQITRVRLFDYRNYERLELAPAPGLCVLVGRNAVGKTNLLESMFLCALGRSHRTRYDNELIRRGQPGSFVGLALAKRSGSHEIECRLRREQGREIKVDGKLLGRSGELLGCLNVVLFAPRDLKLVQQGPAERRRFVDMELSQLKPAYYYRLQRYNAALRQRNALLKEYSTADPALLEVWTRQLAQLGAEITLNRASFLAQIGTLAAQAHAELCDGSETLGLRYQPALQLDEEPALIEAFFRMWMDSAARDAYHGGITANGPHRDDFLLTVNDLDARTYGSQGQQRTAALSLKLAQMRLITQVCDEPPVLLLDDVLSELDTGRQRLLGRAMRGCQTFLTCTDLSGLAASGLDSLGAMAVYRVNDGAVQLEEAEIRE